MPRAVRILALVALAAVATTSQQQAWETREGFPEALSVTYLPPPGYLAPMSLGYREALADLVWLRALAYSGDMLGEADLDALRRFTDAIIRLSPRFHRIYKWGGITPIYLGGSKTITRPMVDVALEVYRRGLQEFPESHELLYALGMLLIHQVPSTEGYTAAEIAEAKREGAELIRRAAAFGADPLVRRYAATLVSEHATEALARQFLESQLATVEDPQHRAALQAKLLALGAEASVEEVSRIRAAFREQHFQHRPYLPDTVFAVLADDHAAPPPDDVTPP